MTNNLMSLWGSQVIVAAGNQTLHLSNNTFDGWLIPLLRPPLEEAPARPVTVVAEGNVLWGLPPLGGEGGAMTSEKVARAQVKWQGRDNLYVLDPSVRRYVSFAQEKREVKSLDEWNRLWGRTEPGSAEVPWIGLQLNAVGNLEPGPALRFARQETEDLRRPLGAAARDVGPEWDLVGPGDAYVRALERSAGKPIPQDRLRPPAPTAGPFVLLRGREEPRGHSTLQAALDASRDGDVIEVRADGPFPGAALKAPARGGRLTVRAAPGYQPGPRTKVHLELPKADVEIEGLVFYDAGHLTGEFGRLTVRNCTLDGWREGPVAVRCVLRGPGLAARFINCLMPKGTACSVGPGQGVLLENCMLNWASLSARADDDDCELVIRRCACWARGPAEGVVACDDTPKSRPRVRAEDTVFVSGSVLAWTGRNARWSGTHNIYSLTSGFSLFEIYTLGAWQKRWDSDRDSLVAPSPFLEPRLWRILSGLPKRPDGAGYGADVDNVARTAAP
jgi:hypothetical protein